MNMMKKNGGFTLVELIVVIAILAILAGVAVPAYTGYIDKANKASDDAQIQVINQAIEAACALNGATGDDATVGFADDGKSVDEVKIGTKDITADYTTFVSGNSIAFKYYATIEGSGANKTTMPVVGVVGE